MGKPAERDVCLRPLLFLKVRSWSELGLAISNVVAFLGPFAGQAQS